MPMAVERESTTVTRCSPTWEAASRAASVVLDSSDDRWMETSRSAPATEAAAVGRDEVTGRGPGGGDALAARRQSAGDVVRADLAALPARAAGEDDVQRHDLDVVLLDQRGRQVGRRISDDGDGHPARLVRGRAGTDGTSRGRGAVRRRRRRRSRAPGRSPRDGRPPGRPPRCVAAAATGIPGPSARSRRSWSGAEEPALVGAEAQHPLHQPPGGPAVRDDDGDVGRRQVDQRGERPLADRGRCSSPPRSTTGWPEIQAAYWSGNRSATSSRVSPSHEPMPCSRRRGSRSSGTSSRSVSAAAVSTARCEVAGHDDGGAAGQPGGQQVRRDRGDLPRARPRPAADRAAPGSGRRRSTPCGRAATPPRCGPAARERRAGRTASPPGRLRGGRLPGPARALSTNGIVGQSFQSRSSA